MTTRFPSGLSTAAPNTALFNLGMPDPTKFHVAFDDFNGLDTTQWVEAATTAASATQTIITGAGGLLQLVNSNVAADYVAITTPTTSFRIDSGKRFFMKARVAVNDVANTGMTFGIGNTALNLNPANGVYISKAAASQATTINVENTSVVQSATMASNGWVNSTFRVIGIEYDPRKAKVIAYLDDVAVASVAAPNFNTGVDLLFFFGIINNNAAANAGTVDYMFIAMER